MLSKEQSKQIEAAAIADVRRAWTRPAPERVAALTEEVRVLVAEGGWAGLSFDERREILARLADLEAPPAEAKPERTAERGFEPGD